MKIHHINCGTMCPFGGRLLHGTGPLLRRASLVCHCVLLEMPDRLVLVDTGLGLDDIRLESGRLNRPFLEVVRPVLDETQTAYRRIEALGLDPRDVRDIVLTHLDCDHAGGISDFPWATVHVMAKEYEAANAGRTFNEKFRYQPKQWAHNPKWSLLAPVGEPWKGFAAARTIGSIAPELLAIPLEGHSRGHAGIAIQTNATWMLHAGDSYFYEGEMSVDHPHCTPGFRLFQQYMALNDRLRRENQERLRDLKRAEGDNITIFCAHSDTEFDQLRERAEANQLTAQ